MKFAEAPQPKVRAPKLTRARELHFAFGERQTANEKHFFFKQCTSARARRDDQVLKVAQALLPVPVEPNGN